MLSTNDLKKKKTSSQVKFCLQGTNCWKVKVKESSTDAKLLTCVGNVISCGLESTINGPEQGVDIIAFILTEPRKANNNSAANTVRYHDYMLSLAISLKSC